MERGMTPAQQRTYDAVFRHPVAHNVGWREVRALLGAIADVEEEQANGHVRVTRGGKTFVLQPERTKEVGTSDLMLIRHFLQSSEATAGIHGRASENGGGHVEQR